MLAVRLDEMSWTEVREVLKKPNVVVLPLGSTEQHGAHLPLNVDVVCGTYLAENAARKVMENHNVQVLVAPTLPYTYVAFHKMYPGTVGVRLETLTKVIEEVVTSFLEQGFNNIITLTTHSENACPMEVALRVVAEHWQKATLVGVTSLGLGFDVRSGIAKAGNAGLGHGLEVETSMVMVEQPELVHLDRAIIGSRKLPLSEKYIGATGFDRSKGVLYYTGTKGFEKSGIQGNPTMASKGEGEKILSAQISDLADIITQVIQNC
jgi:creatinine amidohydrolase